MKPTWKTYDIEEWEHGVAGCSPNPGRPTDRFVFNDCGVCINPHVLGVAAKSWRIGIYTACDERGRWVGGLDVSFLNAGCGYGALKRDANNFPEEWGAQSFHLRRAAHWLEVHSNQKTRSCSISMSSAREALLLISQALESVEPRRMPVYTQLTLF